MAKIIEGFWGNRAFYARLKNMVHGKLPRIVMLVCFSTWLGCRNSTQPAVQPSANTPEEAYRKLMLALLSGNEAEIRPLILPNEESAILWQGKYPAKAAELLAEQYRSMDITRINPSEVKGQESVGLQSSAVPVPMTVSKTNGTWKVDAAPLIELRKLARDFIEKKDHKTKDDP